MIDKDAFLKSVYVVNDEKCWIWMGANTLTHGNRYGTLSSPRGRERGQQHLAHRVSYELFVEHIPEGMVIDHTCRNGLCVNPRHLEPVTNEENILRGKGAPAENARKTHCVRGHLLSGENLRQRKDGKRVCVKCDQARKKPGFVPSFTRAKDTGIAF